MGNRFKKPAKIPKSQEYFWTEEVQRQIRESEEDIAAGRYKQFDNVEDLLKYLNSEEG